MVSCSSVTGVLCFVAGVAVASSGGVPYYADPVFDAAHDAELVWHETEQTWYFTTSKQFFFVSTARLLASNDLRCRSPDLQRAAYTSLVS